jgi:hypothetical protein
MKIKLKKLIREICLPHRRGKRLLGLLYVLLRPVGVLFDEWGEFADYQKREAVFVPQHEMIQRRLCEITDTNFDSGYFSFFYSEPATGFSYDVYLFVPDNKSIAFYEKVTDFLSTHLPPHPYNIILSKI